MIAEVVSIGTELLMGQIVNTDAQLLSRRLSALGISVYYHTTVGDNPERMEQTLRLALSRSDIVITTGGLGPTQDDLSKEIAAKLLGLPMESDAQSLEQIERYFKSAHRIMAENNLRQAVFAKGAKILPNACGTAPGCIVECDGKTIIQLPGPPTELKDMFDRQVMPYLAARTGGTIVSRFVRIFGMGESDVEMCVRDLIEKQGEVTIASYCGTGEVQLRVSTRGQSEADVLPKLAPTIEALRERLGDVVYAVSETSDYGMERYVVELLKTKGLTVSAAESCTGGLVASRLVGVPGASGVLNEAYVTYANEAKVRLLGVDPQTLRDEGAVSESTAIQMAEGLRSRTGAAIAISTTGIAGPDGGTADKPVGLVYLACATKAGTRAKKLQLRGDRQKIRTLATLHALNMIRLAALEQDQ